MEKVRVLRVIARLNIGGPAIHTLLLTRFLNPERFETLLAVGRVDEGEGEMDYLARSLGVKPHVIPEMERRISPWRDLISIIKLYRLMMRFRPHIVHSHTAKAGTAARAACVLYNLSTLPARLLKRTRPALKVHTFHGHVLHSYFRPLQSKIFVLTERLLGTVTDRIVVLSPSQFEELCCRYRVGRPERYRIVPLGLDLSPFLASEGGEDPLRAELGLGMDVFLLGMVGRLVAVKNHTLLFKAMGLLGESRLPVHALIVGDGDNEMALKGSVAELGLEDSVTFTGWRRDLDRVYSSMDLMVSTSLNEGTPVSMIEAMAAARPVVAADVGGVKDLMGDFLYALDADESIRVHRHGVLVPSNDEGRLAEAIRHMMGRRELMREMGEAGRAFVRERFDYRRLLQDMESLYEDLL